MSKAPEFNISTFCSISGVSSTDSMALVNHYGDSETKTYLDWYSEIGLNYNIPNDLRKHFKTSQYDEVTSTSKTKTKK